MPDLALFPERYPGVRNVSFHAGFAGVSGHLAIWMLALLTRMRLLRSMTSLAERVHTLAEFLEPWFRDRGGIFVELEGAGHDGAALRLSWNPLAARNHCPYIPCGGAVALARKLARGERLPCGAAPCVEFLSVEEYLAALDGLDMRKVPPRDMPKVLAV
ncbi:MAG: hypothetical protein MO853_02220 [Candidatus Protistobacter heckmanni]|nr:hypothetical protein [Candidatus Protistobacter heckmanni]